MNTKKTGSDKPKVEFKRKDGQGIATMNPKELEAMATAEFVTFQHRITNLRKRRRYATYLLKNGILITPAHSQELFRTGAGQDWRYANDESDEFKANEVHTNMPRDGKLDDGEMMIISSIEAVVKSFSGLETSRDNGIILKPTGTFPANIDPCLLNDVLCTQFKLAMVRGTQTIVSGRLEDFPQLSGMSAALGASPGGFAQNAYSAGNMLVAPQVIEGDIGWGIVVSPLANLDLTDIPGETSIVIRVNTLELNRVYA